MGEIHSLALSADSVVYAKQTKLTCTFLAQCIIKRATTPLNKLSTLVLQLFTSSACVFPDIVHCAFYCPLCYS